MFSLIGAVIFNVAITSFMAVGIICTFFMYRHKSLPGYAALMAVFLAYLVDNTIVFCTELIPEFADVYDRLFLETPSLKTVCFIVRIVGMLYIVHRSLPAFSLKYVAVLGCVYATALICIPVISDDNWMVFFYYLPSQVIMILVCLWCLAFLRKNLDQYEHKYVRHVKAVLIYTLVMKTLILLEDTYVIFFVDVYLTPSLKIFNRNFSENLMIIGYSIGCILDRIVCLKQLSEYAAIVNAPAVTSPKQFVTRMDPVREFSVQFALTDREQEILRCVLDGKSQQEISDNLVIALGTVKTHTHNIYKKTDTANRNQIIVKYQRFCNELGV